MAKTASTDAAPTGTNDGTKLLGVRIERELHRKAREQAFREDRPLSDLVRDALTRYLAEVAA